MTLSPDVIDGLPSVEGVLNYLAPMAERPMNLAYDPPPGVPRSTGVPEPHRVTIYDARPLAGRLSLDSEGLAVVKHNSAVRDFYDEDERRRVRRRTAPGSSDLRAAARCATRRLRRDDRRLHGFCPLRSGLSRSNRRDLPRQIQRRSPLVLRTGDATGRSDPDQMLRFGPG